MELNTTAYRARQRCIEMAARGGCFLGAALSCVDVIAYLYGRHLRVTPETHSSPNRDYFLLSKGHAVPALYGVLADHGFVEPARLERHLDARDSVYWHPNRDIGGVDFHTGSLGHALAIGVGIALDIKLLGRTDRVVVMLGDGELNEGSIWEALLVASAHELDNLTLVIDRNHLQANVATEDLIPLEPIADKLRAFGCRVASCNGHSFDELDAAFTAPSNGHAGPFAVIADTVRGKGLPSLEGRTDAWFVKLTPEEVAAKLAELETNRPGDDRAARVPTGISARDARTTPHRLAQEGRLA